MFDLKISFSYLFIYIFIGTPLKSGDILIKFVIFDPNAEVQVRDFATLPLNQNLTVAQVKGEVISSC
jgi:hypothetical protein